MDFYPVAAAANRNLTIQFDSTFFNASAADTTILVDTPLDFKSEEYNLISFTGNGYVTLKAANSANPVFTVSGNDVKLAVSGIDFDSSTIVSVSGDNAQVTVKNTSVSGSAELNTASMHVGSLFHADPVECTPSLLSADERLYNTCRWTV